MSQEQQLESKRLLSAYTSSLYKAFWESSRDEAKNRFKALKKGDAVPLLQINFEDNAQLQTQLLLEYSEFRGNLNFSAFINALAALLSEIINGLKSDKEIESLATEDGAEQLFKVVGFSDKSGELNALMLSIRQPEPGVILARLMFMNPEQFKQQPAEQVS